MKYANHQLKFTLLSVKLPSPCHGSTKNDVIHQVQIVWLLEQEHFLN
jgi:hypothetical protein